MMGTGKPAPAGGMQELSPQMKRLWRRRRAQGAVSFLAFFLGMTLILSSLGAVGNRIAWERDPFPRWETDWQNTQAFRDEAAHYLREFLIIGAGGKVDFYDRSYWSDAWDETTAVVQEAEAYRSWWGFYPFQEAVIVDRGTALQESQPASSDSAPAEPEEEREPDEAYRNDKNVLYFIETAEGKTYSNTAGGKDFFLAAERQRHASYLDGRTAQDGYNFYLSFRDGKVSISKDGQDVDVYGSGLYNDESQWFVPGYDNFPVSRDLEGVTVHMAVRRSPERYYGMDYKHGGTYYNSAFYSIARQVEETRSFYKTQAMLFGGGLACFALWLLWKRHSIGLLRRLACLTRRVWTEARVLLVAICAVWAFLPGFLGLNPVYDLLYWAWDGGDSLAARGMAVLRFVTMNLSGVLALFWLCWLLYNDHRYNPKEARRSLLRALFRSLRARDLKRPVEKRLSRRTALMIAAVFLLAAEILSLLINLTLAGVFPAWLIWTVYLLPVLLAAGAVSLFQRCQGGLAKDLGRLADQVEAVRAGDLERPLKLPEDADLRRTAESLNDIQAGMKAALEEQTRSERMKVELVSNVSHDLKTPLTSILSYAELLRQEDLPPAAADYAKIIGQKARRLKTMVEDVFEVSRAAADQLPVHLERLDLAKLLRQTLADMDGAIQESALAFKVDLPEGAVMITADGRRLYRVFQNLLDNALRYALEGSRVYLSLKTVEGTAEASVRNTSRSELPEGVDFTARFVRGDASRTDGGSGLGLSIARSFTEACGGSFRVETVADLFTAVVTFPTEEA